MDLKHTKWFKITRKLMKSAKVESMKVDDIKSRVVNNLVRKMSDDLRVRLSEEFPMQIVKAKLVQIEGDMLTVQKQEKKKKKKKKIDQHV